MQNGPESPSSHRISVHNRPSVPPGQCNWQNKCVVLAETGILHGHGNKNNVLGHKCIIGIISLIRPNQVYSKPNDGV